MGTTVILSDLDSDLEIEEDLVVLTGMAVNCTMLWYGSQFIKTLQHTSVLSGQLWLNELLVGHDGQFYNKLGMQKFAFRRLLTTLEAGTGLHGMWHVSAAEQAVIFLHYMHRGLSNRALQERFQHSGDTIMKWVLHIITQVLNWLSVQVHILCPSYPDIQTSVPQFHVTPHVWCTHPIQNYEVLSFLSLFHRMSWHSGWNGIYPCKFPRANEPHIIIARATCHKMSLQPVTSTSGSSMFSQDGRGVLQTARSWIVQRWMASSSPMDDIIWVMLGTPNQHHSLFHFGKIDTIWRNGPRHCLMTSDFYFILSMCYNGVGTRGWGRGVDMRGWVQGGGEGGWVIITTLFSQAEYVSAQAYIICTIDMCPSQFILLRR